MVVQGRLTYADIGEIDLPMVVQMTHIYGGTEETYLWWYKGDLPMLI